MAVATLLTIFLAGLFGGVHCAAMCGGLALSIENLGDRSSAVPVRFTSRSQLLIEQTVMHCGRVATYGWIGAIVGAIGVPFWRQSLTPLQRTLFVAAALLLIVHGLALLATVSRNRRSPFARFEAAAKRPFHFMTGRVIASPRLLAALAKRPLLRRFAIGLGWGLLPCGLVYGALLLALLSGSALGGALVMLAFGLGTLPNLLALSALSGHLRRVSRSRLARTAAGVLVLGFGILGVWRAWTLPGEMLARGFCAL